MLEIILICAIGLIPPLLSFLFLRKMQMRAQERLRRAMQTAERRQIQRLLSLPVDYQYVEGMGSLIGDFTCRYNARSAHIRCAVNPIGPCEECPHYEPISPPTNSP
jgi:sorbitol-specific phosphotransferase system component IIC